MALKTTAGKIVAYVILASSSFLGVHLFVDFLRSFASDAQIIHRATTPGELRVMGKDGDGVSFDLQLYQFSQSEYSKSPDWPDHIQSVYLPDSSLIIRQRFTDQWALVLEKILESTSLDCWYEHREYELSLGPMGTVLEMKDGDNHILASAVTYKTRMRVGSVTSIIGGVLLFVVNPMLFFFLLPATKNRNRSTPPSPDVHKI